MVRSTQQKSSSMQSDSFWEIRIPNHMSDGRREVDKFVARIEAWGVSHEESLALRHSLHEAVVNAVRHGNGGDPSRSVRICYRFLSDDIFIEVEDEGRGFDRSSVADPTTDANRIRPGGRGLLMMRHFMTSVEYNDRGNCVTMRRTCQRA
ncbi:MAG: serine/threonine-protein kinase RsbW [Planctomycetaceae bacterium]|jgi:serine/threonine-protein kinase RsbW